LEETGKLWIQGNIGEEIRSIWESQREEFCARGRKYGLGALGEENERKKVDIIWV